MTNKANIIKVTAAELLPGDDNDGEIVTTVDVRGDRTFITYEDDDTRYRANSADVYTVARKGGVSTVRQERKPATRGFVGANENLKIEAEIGNDRERALVASLRRDRL